MPGTAAPVPIVFQDMAGSTCGALLPTGNAVDVIEGVEVTLIDNGMPVRGAARRRHRHRRARKRPRTLEANAALRAKLEAIRLKAGPLMNLGDVARQVGAQDDAWSRRRAQAGPSSTRTFIPHRCHDAIGVLGAVSVATACLLPDGPAAKLAVLPGGSEEALSIEHPTGEMTVVATLDKDGNLLKAGILRTARKLFDGMVFGR